ncbi:MAG: hypothetical protein A2452_10570 [Candidatus Firestonebacteria bacterium RIFOXYC2_FULL_39_67]|nr:MAG: hypothetical protein A2452_10570 [Candidatus Firestonebacteria bacterium RIFOXYC2_FULL_39_67]
MVKFERIKSVKKHLKICVYGGTGTGKTYFALGFEKALIIDLEAGSDLYAERFPNTLIFKTKSFNEVCEAVSEIERTLPKLNIQTLILDPVTILWNQLLDSKLEAKKLKLMRSNGKANLDSIDLTFSDWGDIKRKYNTLLTRLCNLDVNIILIGRVKDEYEIKNVNGHMELTKIGVKMNSEKDTPYALDILFRLECEKDGKRFAVFEKDRSGTFPVGFRLENPSFKDFQGILDKHNKGELGPKQSIDEEESAKDAQAELIREAKLQEMFDWFNDCTTTLELKTITDTIEKNKSIFTPADMELLRQEYIRKHKELTSNHNLVPVAVGK